MDTIDKTCQYMRYCSIGRMAAPASSANQRGVAGKKCGGGMNGHHVEQAHAVALQFFVQPHITRASQTCECASKAAAATLHRPRSILAMSTMITFAANNEFFRKRKRASPSAQ